MEPEFISIEEVMKIYGLSKKYTTKLLNTKGCPVLPRRKGQKYRVNKVKFAEWLDSRVR